MNQGGLGYSEEEYISHEMENGELLTVLTMETT